MVPFGTVLLSALTATAPEYTAPDLAGLNPDMASLKISVAAFRPALEKKLRETHGVELLAMYVYPAQVVFCRKPLTSLSDLSGRRVRVSSAGQADFVEALDAVPVHIAFARIVPGIESGSVDCAITGTMSGNTLGLQQGGLGGAACRFALLAAPGVAPTGVRHLGGVRAGHGPGAGLQQRCTWLHCGAQGAHAGGAAVCRG